MSSLQSTKSWGTHASVIDAELVDMVLSVTQASRAEHGEVVWFGWNGGEAGQVTKASSGKKIQFGSHAVSFTRAAATALHGLMPSHCPQHFDLWLKEVLTEAHKEKNAWLAASYVVPPIGGFMAHETGNKEGSVRGGCWKDVWAKEGSASSPDKNGANRWLALFGGKGAPKYLLQIEFPVVDTRFHWTTAQPPSCMQDADEDFLRLSRSLGYISGDGYWVGPAWIASEYKQTKAGASRPAGRWTPDPNRELLRHYPHECPDCSFGPAGKSPVSRIALDLATRTLDPTEFGTARKARRRNTLTNQWHRRFFAKKQGDKAGSNQSVAIAHCTSHHILAN